MICSVCGIDSQIFSGQKPLNEEHGVAKYQNVKVVDIANCRFLMVHPLGKRSAWSLKFIDFLLELGLTKRLLAGITTRVLNESYMNWIRWSWMTYGFKGSMRLR